MSLRSRRRPIVERTNSCTLDACPIAKIGATTARGVAVVDTSVADAELKRLDGLGVRGIRFNLVQSGATTIPTCSSPCRSGSTILAGTCKFICWATRSSRPRAYCNDWRRQSSSTIWRASPQHCGDPIIPLSRLPLKLIDQGTDLDQSLSGAYQDTKIGPPTYADTSKVAVAFAKAAPERMVWGWRPGLHPTEKANAKPGTMPVLFEFFSLAAWAPDEAIRNRILVDNPA